MDLINLCFNCNHDFICMKFWSIIILQFYLGTFKRGYLSSLANKFYLCQIT